MTKKDYVALAQALNRVKSLAGDSGERQQWRTDVATVADVLAADSPRFDRERFIEACETGSDRESAKRARSEAKARLAAQRMDGRL